MTQLEEQLSKFYPEAIEVETEDTKRYSIVWWVVISDSSREILVIYDKLEHRIVYKGNSKSRKTHYDYIKSFYGEKNCDPPRQVNPQFYEGL